VAIGFQREFASLLGVPADRVSLGHVGLNHLTWERSVWVDDKDMLPGLLASFAERIAPHTGLSADFIRHLGMVPSYYLRYYYAHDTVVSAQRGTTTRAEEVSRLESELLELYADPALDTKPAQLAQRGGAWYSEAAVDLLVSLTSEPGAGATMVVNTGNGGTLPFLPADAVIEVPAVVGSGGAVPVPVDPVDPLLRGLIAHVYAYEELALDAAVRGGRDRVYDALLAHPLVGQADRAQCLTDRLIAENARYLPWA
jgi:6-phospho-beta-glucosidase